jgi:hypothetical protein
VSAFLRLFLDLVAVKAMNHTSNNVIQRAQKWNCINHNQQPPNLRALTELQKPTNPIRLKIGPTAAHNLTKYSVKLLDEIMRLL